MYKYITFILLLLGSNSIAQSYSKNPTIIFDVVDDKPVMIFLSTNGSGILSEGDTLSIRVYREQEYKWLYLPENEVNLSNTMNSVIIPAKVIPNLKRGGVHYFMINQDAYIYENTIRDLQVKNANQILKDF